MYAAYLSKKGIKPGDRILVFVPMSINLYKIVLATFYIGAVAVFLDEWVSKKRMEHCCQIADCRGFVAPFKLRVLSVFSQELRKIPLHLYASAKIHAKIPEINNVNASDTALITFTTGSTGTPKAANRTHGFLRAQYDALQPLLSTESIVDITTLPIVLLLNLANNKTSVIADFNPRKPAKFNPEIIFNQLEKTQVASLTFSPYFLVETGKYMIKNELKLHNLKHILVGGGPVFLPDAHILKQAFPNADITFVYGSTEAEPIAHTSISDFIKTSSTASQNQGLYVGEVDASSEVKIIAFADEPLNSIHNKAENGIGEIVVNGNHVLTSYFNSNEAFRLNKIVVGKTVWHRTGDAGSITQDNKLFLFGRCKQILKFNNISYYPFLIEQYLKTIDGIVVGTLIEINGIPILVIKPLNKNQMESIIIQLQKSPYSHFKVHFIEKMPMDKRHNSKIDYELLSNIVT